MVHQRFGEVGVFGREVLAGIVSHGVQNLAASLLTKGGEKAGEEAAKRLTVEQRPLLLKLLHEMETEADKGFGPKSVADLVRRHEEAMTAKRENEFVTLLTKIVTADVFDDPDPAEKMRKQKEMLRFLNALPDPLFYQALYLVKHDVIPQLFARLRREAAPEFEGLANWLESRRFARR
jgi:hypothetical protein